MKPRRLALVAFAVAAGVGQAGSARADAVTIPVVLATSGSGSFSGKGQQAALEALAALVNKSGGINGQDVKFAYQDDQTNPQVAVLLINQILGDKPRVVLGSTLAGMCRAMAPLFKNGPVQYCLLSSLHPTPGSYSFS